MRARNGEYDTARARRRATRVAVTAGAREAKLALGSRRLETPAIYGLEMILALGYRVRMPLLEADSQTLVTETSHDLDLTAQRRHIAPQRRHQHVLSILGF